MVSSVKIGQNFIMLRFSQLFGIIVIDGVEILNGDFETLVNVEY